MSRRESRGDSGSRRPPPEMRDAKRPRHEVHPPCRLFVLSNLSFDLSERDVCRKLDEVGARRFRVSVPMGGGGRRRNNGFAIVRLHPDDTESIRAVEEMHHLKWDNRNIAVIEPGEDLAVCVKRSTCRNEDEVRRLFPPGHTRGIRRVGDVGDYLWFVDMVDVSAFENSLGIDTRGMFTILCASRFGGGREHFANDRPFPNGGGEQSMERDIAFERDRTRGREWERRERGRFGDGDFNRDRERDPGGERNRGFDRERGHDSPWRDHGRDRMRDRPSGRDIDGPQNYGGRAPPPRGFERDWDHPPRGERGDYQNGNGNWSGRPQGGYSRSPIRNHPMEYSGPGAGATRSRSPPRDSRIRNHGTRTTRALIDAIAEASDFHRSKFDPDLAWHMSNLEFQKRVDIPGYEACIRGVVEHQFGGVRVKSVFFLGRMCANAVVLLNDPESFSKLPPDGGRILIMNRYVNVQKYGRGMVLLSRVPLEGPADLEELKRLVHSDNITQSQSDKKALTVWDDYFTVLKLCCIDGYSTPTLFGNEIIGMSVARSIPADELPPPQALAGLANRNVGTAGQQGSAAGDGTCTIRIENVPRGTSGNRVLQWIKSEGRIQAWLNVENTLNGNTHFLSGLESKYLGTVLALNNRPFYSGDVQPRDPVRIHVVEGGQGGGFDTNKHLNSSMSVPHEGGGIGGHSPPGRRNGEFGHVIPQGGADHAREGFQREGDGRLNRDFEPPYRDSRNVDGQPSRHGMKVVPTVGPSPGGRSGGNVPSADKASGNANKRVAGASSMSRGFRASPVTPSSTVEYVSVAQMQKPLPPAALPTVVARLAGLKTQVHTRSLPNGYGNGSVEDFFTNIMGNRKQSVIDAVLKKEDEEDTPQTQHVWSGLMFMEGRKLGGSMPDLSSTGRELSEDCHPAHCNGFVVVKRDQSDNDVNNAIAMLPVELNIVYRIGWDSMKHMHVIGNGSVVFMIRSSLDVQDGSVDQKPLVLSPEESGRGRLVISAVNSQKSVLGILRNLRNKQRIGVCRYSRGSTKLVALCVPPSAHAFEKLAVPWRFQDMAGHDTMLLVVGPADAPEERD